MLFIKKSSSFILYSSLSFVFLFFLNFKNASALSFLPFNLFLKPYVGTTLNLDAFSQDGPSLESGFSRIYKNVDLNFGLRVHKFFGFQLGYTENNIKFDNFLPDSKLRMAGFHMDGQFYFPLFDIMGNSIEFYGTAGFLVNEGSINQIKENVVSPKFGAGIQFRIFGSIALKTGYEYLITRFKDIDINDVHFIKMGAEVYFM